MKKADREHFSRVAQLGCILCLRLGYGETPATIHHIRDGQGMSQRADHDEAIPLCREHHQGDTGIHGLGRRAFQQRYKCDERDLLADTRLRLGFKDLSESIEYARRLA